ncbi:unnamed protein product [Schistosoma guineensis]|nr:unnamed protein product [Schistosoma guineensis]
MLFVFVKDDLFPINSQNSPSPTRYDIKRLVVVRPISYGFKNTGRMRQCSTFTNDGLWLLPGAYNVNGVDEKLNQCHRTYSFKNIPRKFNDLLFGLQDKNLCLSPGQYNPYGEEQIKKTQLPSYHSVFKSKYPRSVSSQKQDNVPPPGAYNLSFNETFGIISPFVSQVPRFKRSKSVHIKMRWSSFINNNDCLSSAIPERHCLQLITRNTGTPTSSSILMSISKPIKSTKY